MQMNSIQSVDLASVLLGVNDERDLVCGIVLDALYSFKANNASSRNLASILKEHEAVFMQCEAKMEGLVDALREYQTVHTIHHSVMDQLCSFVENECINDISPHKSWVSKVFVLLGTIYDENLLASLLNLALGPFPISQGYVRDFVGVIFKQIRAALVLDNNFATLAEGFARKFEFQITEYRKEGRDGSVIAYLTEIKDMLVTASRNLPVSSGNGLREAQSIGAEASADSDLLLLGVVESCTKRLSFAVRLLIVFGVAALLVFALHKVQPHVVKNWNTIEPWSWSVGVVVTILLVVVTLFFVFRPKSYIAKQINSFLCWWLKFMLWDKATRDHINEIGEAYHAKGADECGKDCEVADNMQ